MRAAVSTLPALCPEIHVNPKSSERSRGKWWETEVLRQRVLLLGAY